MSDEGEEPRGPDAAFVLRLVARDETAFNELVELYERRVHALVYRMIGRREEAEEVTQDVFVQVFKAIDRFRGESKLSTWIFRVAVNLCKNRMKYNARRVSVGGQDLETIAEHTSLDGGRGVSTGTVERPDELMEGVQLEHIVKRALAGLEPEFRELVVLCDVEDLSYEEIAEIASLPVGTVKSRIHRGRKQLRAAVEQILGARGERKRDG